MVGRNPTLRKARRMKVKRAFEEFGELWPAEKRKSYPAFNPIIYSVDTLLPIVDLEMQGAWIPDARASWWGIGARVYLWLHIALGWFFSLLAVAGFSGLIKPE